MDSREFPYLVESSPALPNVLQNLVDHEGREGGLLTVICGSTQQAAALAACGHSFSAKTARSASGCWRGFSSN